MGSSLFGPVVSFLAFIGLAVGMVSGGLLFVAQDFNKRLALALVSLLGFASVAMFGSFLLLLPLAIVLVWVLLHPRRA